jgi:Secretion system C-terminal sorting domain
MKIKLLLAILLCSSALIRAQETVFSAQKGTTFFLPKELSPVSHPATDQKVFTKAQGKTVFFDIPLYKPTVAASTLVPEFIGITPKWLNWNRDLVFSAGTSVGVAYSNHLEVKDGIIELFGSGARQGSYIKRINSLTGATLWEHHSNRKTYNKLELDVNLYETASGDIQVFGHRLFTIGDIGFFPAGMVYQKLLNGQTGVVLTRKWTEWDQGGQPNLNSYGVLGVFAPLPNSSQVLNCEIAPFGQDYANIAIIDENCKIVDTSMHLSTPFGSASLSNSFRNNGISRLSNGNTVIGLTITGFEPDTSSIFNELVWVDQVGKIMKRKEITTEINHSALGKVIPSGDRFLYLGQSYADRSKRNFEQRSSVLIMDLDGQILFNEPLMQHNGKLFGASVAVPERSGDGFIYAVEALDSRCLRFYHQKKDFSLNLLREICPTNPKHKFELSHVVQASNGDVITGFLLQTDSVSYDINTGTLISNFGGYDRYTMSLSAADLGLLSDIDETIVQKNVMLIAPNPTRDVISIQFGEPTSGQISVFDLSGKLVMSQFVTDQLSLDLEAYGIPKGLYVVQFKNDKLISSAKVVLE